MKWACINQQEPEDEQIVIVNTGACIYTVKYNEESKAFITLDTPQKKIDAYYWHDFINIPRTCIHSCLDCEKEKNFFHQGITEYRTY